MNLARSQSKLLRARFCTAKPKCRINFDDTKYLQRKSEDDLKTSVLVFSLCKIKPLVKSADVLVKYSYKILGEWVTNLVLRPTFFKQFCASETLKGVSTTTQALLDAHIGSIYDYAAEADEPPAGKGQQFVGRKYDPSIEAACIKHVDTFTDCINAAKENSNPQFRSFSAIKATALGDPKLLKQVTNLLSSFHHLYTSEFSSNKLDPVTRDRFKQFYGRVFESGSADALYDKLLGTSTPKGSASEGTDAPTINYLNWIHNISIDEIEPLIASNLKNKSMLTEVLNKDEKVLYTSMMGRFNKIVTLAKGNAGNEENEVRLFIDAEQTYFQPAIDYISNDLMTQYNSKANGSTYPVVFGTYQMYLLDSYERLEIDIARAEKFGYTFAAKLVRGAYMKSEREYLIALGLSEKEVEARYPIFKGINLTHNNYNKGVSYVINQIAKNKGTDKSLEVMFASHNRETMEHAVGEVDRLKLPANCGIYFGQLLGMADHLTYNLGDAGFIPYKYVPFGKIREVIPYLVRRLVENGDALGGADLEIKLAKGELERRRTAK